MKNVVKFEKGKYRIRVSGAGSEISAYVDDAGRSNKERNKFLLQSMWVLIEAYEEIFDTSDYDICAIVEWINPDTGEAKVKIVR